MPEPHLRAADADRTAVAELLGQHMAAGRLTVAEYEERLARAYASRTYGDLENGVHYTQQDGDSASITFTGTGIDFLTETNSDEGDIAVTLDGVAKGTVSANTAQRHTRFPVYSVTGLAAGRHTLTVSKKSGTYFLVDGFRVS